jgi:hypothetical protein
MGERVSTVAVLETSDLARVGQDSAAELVPLLAHELEPVRRVCDHRVNRGVRQGGEHVETVAGIQHNRAVGVVRRRHVVSFSTQ